MKIRKALVVYKRSLLERYRKSPHLRRLSPAIRGRLLKNDLENRMAIDEVFSTLVKHQIDFRLKARGRMKSVRGYDLVIVVGGDGTFFGVSRFVERTPVMLVNSDPTSSLGLFACCSRNDFEPKLAALLGGRLSLTPLNRLQLSIPSRKVEDRVLNDILFAHTNPGNMTRYFLQAGERREFQQSSGIWVSTAAGSTGSVMSAGGRMMPLSSKKMQWVVREPYSHRGIYRLLSGFSGRRLEIVPESMECAVWVDGSRTMHEVGPGETITLRTPGTPLTLVGYSDARRQDLFGRWVSRGE